MNTTGAFLGLAFHRSRLGFLHHDGALALHILHAILTRDLTRWRHCPSQRQPLGAQPLCILAQAVLGPLAMHVCMSTVECPILEHRLGGSASKCTKHCRHSRRRQRRQQCQTTSPLLNMTFPCCWTVCAWSSYPPKPQPTLGRCCAWRRILRQAPCTPLASKLALCFTEAVTKEAAHRGLPGPQSIQIVTQAAWQQAGHAPEAVYKSIQASRLRPERSPDPAVPAPLHAGL